MVVIGRRLGGGRWLFGLRRGCGDAVAAGKAKRLTVSAAVQADLAVLAKRAPELARGSLAATALALAAEMDAEGNSATSKAMCARALQDAMDRLLELAPAQKETDRLDDLASRRAARLDRRAAAADSARS